LKIIARVFVTALFLCLASVGSVKADVIFVGDPSAQKALVAVCDRLPACCRAKASLCVKLLNDRDMNAYLARAGAADIRYDAIDGVYDGDLSTITLRLAFPNADISATFAHEYGHFVWQRIFTKEQRKRYEQEYKAELRARNLISTYAAVSVEEGFAETFSAYVLTPSAVAAKCPASCHCLDELLRP
jgi:hypothetical protein